MSKQESCGLACLFRVAGIFLGLVLTWLPPAAAQAPPVPIDLPAQPLSQALAALSKQAGVEIIAPGELVAGRQAPSVRGTMTPSSALERLLAGSGLEAVPAPGGGFVVRRAAQVPVEEQRLPEVRVQAESSVETAFGPVDGYMARRASSGTKTDTVLIETPRSISVVTRDRMDAQAVASISEAILYLPGVTGAVRDERTDFFLLRGFDAAVYRDGLKIQSSALALPRFEPFGAERAELLRGPASVLYGQNSPGGLVNIVSKRPVSAQLRSLELQIGNFDRLQGALDFGGPVDSDKTLFYRLTALARDSETFVDFVGDDRVFIAPALTWVPNADTSVTFLAHLQHDRTGTVRQFLPASGTLFLNPHGKIPRNRFAGEPGFENLDRTQYSLGYLLEHRLSERWTLRQNARYDYLDIDYKALFGFGLQADLQTLNRFSLATLPEAHSLAIDTRLQTHIGTGALIHTILLGFDYQRYRLDNRQGFSFAAPAIDIFNPSYGAPVTSPAFSTNVLSEQDQMGFYLQDQ